MMSENLRLEDEDYDYADDTDPLLSRMAEGDKGTSFNPGDGEPRQHPTEIISALQRRESSETEQVSFWKLFKGNWLSVTMDCLVFGSFGMGVAFLGPTLFDLGCQTNSNLKEMNWVFFVQLIMTLVGSISAGCLADRMVPVHVLLLIGMVGLPITMFFIPMCSAFAALLIDLMLMGWCMGCIDCVTNLRMILRFGVNVSPFLQAMYFFYGLGAFISPMIAAPFVLNVDCSPFIDGVTQETVTETGKQTISISPSPQKVSRSQHLSHAKIAFAILGGIQLLISIIVVVVITLEKKRIIGTGASVSQSSSTHSIFSETGKHFERGRCFTCGTREVVIITLLTSFSMFIYDGVQSSFADYIYSYAEKNIDGLERSEGAGLNACFWGLFAFGRLIAVPWATWCNPEFMLLVNLSGGTVTLLITLIWRTHHTVIYIGACFIGFFISSLSPSVMSLTEQYIDINPSITTCLVVSAAMGEALCPVIVGNLFVLAGPPSFLTFCLSILVISFGLYWVLFLCGRTARKYKESRHTSFIWLPGYDRKSAGESTLINPSAVKYYSRMKEESVDNLELGNVKQQSNGVNGVHESVAPH